MNWIILYIAAWYICIMVNSFQSLKYFYDTSFSYVEAAYQIKFMLFTSLLLQIPEIYYNIQTLINPTLSVSVSIWMAMHFSSDFYLYLEFDQYASFLLAGNIFGEFCVI
jgi:hypothetical protein